MEKVGIFAPRNSLSKNKNYCSVPRLLSRAYKDLNLRFHKFPKENASTVEVENYFGGCEELDRLEAWLRAFKMNKKSIKKMRVCSLHFKYSD